jgi:L-aspartate oxidase
LASGGAGQVYSDTTNPAVATGDGIAMAWNAGAEIADMEFYQFHPTALSLPGVPRFLLSEALRGEGAYLRNAAGERFMEQYHPMMELAPRDVVARAITREGMGPAGETLPVYLDMRHVTAIDPATRFPGISKFLAEHKLDLHRDLIPVRPAAHYLMGGVLTDVHGRTSLPRLYAAGEVACTGVHGANRLASNSLLEGLVFGARAAEAMAGETPPPHRDQIPPWTFERSSDDFSDALRRLQGVMWKYAGLLRDAESLRLCQDTFEKISSHKWGWTGKGYSRARIEFQNLMTVADMVVRSALGREESRGAHFRNDFPRRDDFRFQKHSVLAKGQKVSFVEFSHSKVLV